MTNEALNALVAEKIMGWTWRTYWGPEEMRGLFPPPGADLGYHPEIPEYCDDIASAFEVVDHLKSKGYTVAFAIGADACTASIMLDGKIVGFQSHPTSAPQALCLAALEAYGVTV